MRRQPPQCCRSFSTKPERLRERRLGQPSDAFDGWKAVVPFPKFSCHAIHERRINDGSVKALLEARVHLQRGKTTSPGK